MSTTRRREPLHAPESATDNGSGDGVVHEPAPVPHTGDSDTDDRIADDRIADDRRRFADAVRMLRTGGSSLNLSERTLMVLAGIVAPSGLVCVLLGWYGASRTPNLFEQIPYLISGGLFGLGLVFLGSFFYFAHWLTELVKESRSGSAALLEAVNRLQETMADAAASHPAGSTDNGARRPDTIPVLVATARGAMAHRPDCVIVAGKDGLRAVDPSDGMDPCKMCDPFTPAHAEHASV